jgi:hypothetical protein
VTREKEDHWWLSRGTRRCNGSKEVNLGVPRLLPCGKELRRGISKVAGVSTTTPAVRPRRTATGAGDKIPPRPNPLTREIFYLPVDIHCMPSTNHGDRRESERKVTDCEGG